MKSVSSKQVASREAGRRDPIRFRTTILTAGKTTTGIRIPDEIIAQLCVFSPKPISNFK